MKAKTKFTLVLPVSLGVILCLVLGLIHCRKTTSKRNGQAALDRLVCMSPFFSDAVPLAELSQGDAWRILGPAAFAPCFLRAIWDNGAPYEFYTIRFPAGSKDRCEKIYYNNRGIAADFFDETLRFLNCVNYSSTTDGKMLLPVQRFYSNGLWRVCHAPNGMRSFFEKTREDLRIVFATLPIWLYQFKREFASYKSGCLFSFLNDNPPPDWLVPALLKMVSCDEYDPIWKEYCIQYLGLLALSHPDTTPETQQEILAFLLSLLRSTEGVVSGTACEVLAEASKVRGVTIPVSVTRLIEAFCEIVFDETLPPQSRILAFDAAIRMGARKSDFPKIKIRRPDPPGKENMDRDSFEMEVNWQILGEVNWALSAMRESDGGNLLLFCR